MAAFSLSVRSLQTESVCTSTESTPTFLAASWSQPESVRSLAAASPTFLPMSLPSKPTKGTGLPASSLMLSSVAMSTTPASLAALAMAGPMVWSGTVMAMPLAPAEMASLTRLTPRLGSSLASNFLASAPRPVAVSTNEFCKSMKYCWSALLLIATNSGLPAAGAAVGCSWPAAGAWVGAGVGVQAPSRTLTKSKAMIRMVNGFLMVSLLREWAGARVISPQPVVNG